MNKNLNFLPLRSNLYCILHAIFPFLYFILFACGGGGGDSNNEMGELTNTEKIAVYILISEMKDRACSGKDEPTPFVGDWASLMLKLEFFFGDIQTALKFLGVSEQNLINGANAMNCEEVFKTENNGNMPSQCTNEGTSWCDGDIKHECKSKGNYGLLEFTQDCSTSGHTCKIEEKEGKEEAGCDMWLQCGENAFKCNGNIMYICWSGIAMELHCEVLGLTCGTKADKVGCIGIGTACASITPYCEGSQGILCLGGHEAKIDCSQLTNERLTCNPDSIKDIEESASEMELLEKTCKIASSQCTGDKMRCEGSRLIFCLNGYERIIDCSKYGFNMCKSTNEGSYCWGFPNK